MITVLDESTHHPSDPSLWRQGTLSDDEFERAALAITPSWELGLDAASAALAAPPPPVVTAGAFAAPSAAVSSMLVSADPRDARPQQRLGARRGAPVVVARLEGDEHRRAARALARLAQRHDLRVVFAVADPNPHVRGHGRDTLRAAGVAVEEGFDPDAQRAAEHGIAPWRRFITAGRAHVTLKAAASLDGCIATRGGESRWITSPQARRDGHLLRAGCDAVLVGSETVRLDDPLLTVRDVPFERAPARVVVSRDAALPLGARLVATAREAPTWVLCREDAPEVRRRDLAAAGVRVLPVTAHGAGGGVDLLLGLRALAAEGVVSVLCEGGGRLHGALRDAGLVDRVVFYVAPMLFGGGGARAVGGDGALGLADATRLGEWTVRAVGPDLRLEAEVR